MPTTTAPPEGRPAPLRNVDRRRFGLIAAGAAAFAAGELLAGLALGFFERGRLDPAPFLALRPWLLLAAALAAARAPWRVRLALYAAALLLSAVSQAGLLWALGAPTPWVGALRGLAAGALAAVPLDLLVQAGRRWRSRWATAATAALLAALLALPPVLGAYQALAWSRPGPPPAAAAKPRLLLVTALPIVWGEGGAFDPGSRPAQAYRLLQEEFEVRVVDSLDERSLVGARLMLVAQPRWLSPSELVALDAWVRGGGRTVILTDPALVWPSELPIGDVRRAPPVGLLGPLLDHWGVPVDPPERPTRRVESWNGRRLVMEGAGSFRTAGGNCSLAEPWLASCGIGRGRALLVADADLIRDDLWLGPPAFGEQPFSRTADNALLVADLLDGLAGVERPRRWGRIAWMPAEAPWREAVGGALALLVLIALGGLLRSRGRTR